MQTFYTLIFSLYLPKLFCKEVFRTTDSSVCRRDCIDAGEYFCPSKYDGYYGSCCRKGETCPNNDNICSTDAPKDSKGLKYWTCPHTVK